MECLQNVYGPQQTLYPLLSPLKLNIKISFVLIKLQMILQIKSDKYLIRWFYFWRNSLLAVTKDNGTGSQEGRLPNGISTFQLGKVPHILRLPPLASFLIFWMKKFVTRSWSQPSGEAAAAVRPGQVFGARRVSTIFRDRSRHCSIKIMIWESYREIQLPAEFVGLDTQRGSYRNLQCDMKWVIRNVD